MSKRILKTILLMALVAATLLLTACGKKEPPAPTATPMPPAAHGYPNGAVSGQDKLDILNKLDTNHELLYIFEAESDSKDVAKMLGSTYESPLRLDGEGYVRGSGDEGFVKLTVDRLDERIYWKDSNVYFRVEKNVLGEKGNDTFNRVKQQNSLQSRLIKAVSIPQQLSFLKENVDLLSMDISGDNVYIVLKDVNAQNLKRLLQPQVNYTYYTSLRGGIISDS
ncbi:MAG: hypothetical protein GX650_06995, partial [Clostridiales bacterium]|nr:hypothetical protein [Clostridiales bacterium]